MLFEPQGLRPILENWWIIAYTGLISVGMDIPCRRLGQRIAPPADAAIILSMEAVFAALAGWIFLHGVLTPIQISGCIVMLLGMLLAESDVIFQKRDSRMKLNWHEGKSRQKSYRRTGSKLLSLLIGFWLAFSSCNFPRLFLPKMMSIFMNLGRLWMRFQARF